MEDFGKFNSMPQFQVDILFHSGVVTLILKKWDTKLIFGKALMNIFL